MKKRQRVFVCAAIAVAMLFTGLIGCSTMELPDNATPAERQAAMCQDAMKGLAVGQIGVSMATNPDQVTYWHRWLEGARQAIAVYCME